MAHQAACGEDTPLLYWSAPSEGQYLKCYWGCAARDHLSRRTPKAFKESSPHQLVRVKERSPIPVGIVGMRRESRRRMERSVRCWSSSRQLAVAVRPGSNSRQLLQSPEETRPRPGA